MFLIYNIYVNSLGYFWEHNSEISLEKKIIFVKAWRKQKKRYHVEEAFSWDVACSKMGANLVYPSPHCAAIYMCLLGDNWVYK